MNKELFHKLEGTKICFKELSINDAEAIHEYASDEDVSRFIGWKLMKTLEETRDYVEELIRREAAGTHLYASIIEKQTGLVVGTAMIFGFDHEARYAEIGYVFHKNHWGCGYASESIALMNKFAFEILELHKLHAHVVDSNIGSAKALEKNGFVLEGQFKDYYFIEDNYYDGLFYGKINVNK